MISSHNLKNLNQACSYYQKDNYYTKGSGQGLWQGRAAADLGLSGTVRASQYRELLSGKLPDGTLLPGQGPKRVLATDFTFSAPKSVSIVGLVSGDKEVLEAHKQAVTKAFAWLETHSAEARITEKGITRTEGTGNLLAARYEHDISRELDPQLHTHCVTMNLTKRSDGVYRAIDNRKLHADRRTADALYRVELGAGLMRLGYELEQTHPDGRFEIKGISREHIEQFSKRRKQIEEELEKRDLSSSDAASVAALNTRKAKTSVNRRELKASWREQAQEVGLNLGSLRRRAHRFKGKLGFDREASREAVEWAVDHLSERQSLFSLEDLTREAFERGVGRIDTAGLSHAIEKQELLNDPLGLIRIGKGEFTTRKALKLEGQILDLAEEGKGSFLPVLGDRAAQVQLSDYPLNKDQAQALRTLLTSRDGVIGVQGYAGTGKTTMLRTFNELAQGAGVEVVGMSNTASAANLLEQDAGIPSTTTAQLLISEARKSDPWAMDKVPKPDFWVVDEASMLSTREAYRLLRLAERRNARLVFVGDKSQLPAIEAGKPFGMLQKKGAMEVAELRTIVRQKSGSLKRAIEATIQGRDLHALDKLSDRIMEIKEREPRLRAVADDYLKTYVCSGERPMAITGLNKDRVALNDMIREGLQEQGELRGKTVQTQVLVSRSYTRAQLSDYRSFQSGDVLRFGRKYRSLGVSKGAYARVVEVCERSRKVTMETEHGHRSSFAPGRINKFEVYSEQSRELQKGDLIRWTRNDLSKGRRNGELARVVGVSPSGDRVMVDSGQGPMPIRMKDTKHWDHGYASTIHAAQGQSPKEVIVHLDTRKTGVMGRESWYVAITRGKESLRVYTDSEERLPQAITRTLEQRSALEALQELQQRQAQQDHMRRGPDLEPHLRKRKNKEGPTLDQSQKKQSEEPQKDLFRTPLEQRKGSSRERSKELDPLKDLEQSKENEQSQEKEQSREHSFGHGFGMGM